MFPNYKTITKKHSLLFWEWTITKKIKDEWKDLGSVDSVYDKDIKYTITCQLCKRELRIGKENNKTFRYCPRCMEKIAKYKI